MIAEHTDHPGHGAQPLEFRGDVFRRHEPSTEHPLDDEIAEDADDVRAGRVGAIDHVAQLVETVEG